jgi:hypothetical protein
VGLSLSNTPFFYKNETTKEYAIIKVRTSPHFGSNLIEIQVDLASVPVEDDQGKDIVVMWKMYDGFDANGTYRTDSNGWAMVDRKIVPNNTDYRAFIARNYVPV